MLDRISFVFGEGMAALRRNAFMTFAAVSTVAVSLFLLGGLGYTYMRAVDYARTIPGKFDMRVFLLPGATPQTISKTAATIRAIPGVASVAWIPRDKAWEKEKQSDPALTVGLDNPYPDGFKVSIKSLNVSDSVAAALAKLPEIDPDPGVVYLKEEQHLIDDGLQVMRWLGLVIAGLLFLTAGVLIFNAIKLTITSRRREIRIMQLVGASLFTVKAPFLIEGVVQGISGGLLAALMLNGAQNVFQKFLLTLSSTAHLTVFPTSTALVLLGGAGGAYGLICSALAVSSTKGAQ